MTQSPLLCSAILCALCPRLYCYVVIESGHFMLILTSCKVLKNKINVEIKINDLFVDHRVEINL